MVESEPRLFGIADLEEVRFRLQGAYDAPVGKGSQQFGFIDLCHASWYIRSGAVAVRCGDRGLELGPGDWFVGDDVHRRTQVFAPGTHIVSVRLQIQHRRGPVFRFAGLPDRLPAGTVPELLPAAEALVAALPTLQPQTLREWQRARLPLGDYLQVRRRLVEWLAVWVAALEHHGHGPRPFAVGDERVSRALAVLDECEGLSPLPLEALRQATGLGRAQLDRLFRGEFGVSLRGYLDQRCLARAQDLLEPGEHSVKEIAARLGFVDSSHFAKWFRRQTGLAPATWRREGQGV